MKNQFNERPIRLHSHEVLAILDGSKTQLRRVMNRQPQMVTDNGVLPWEGDPKALFNMLEQTGNAYPYGKPGDRLWVKETHAMVFEVDIPEGRPRGPIGTMGIPALPDWVSRYVYRADGEMPNVQWHHFGDSQPVRWTRSTHMRRCASRITLEITGVSVERLQDISEADAKQEGCPPSFEDYSGNVWTQPFYKYGFRKLWQSTSGHKSWDANQWVDVVEFKVLEVTR